LFTVFHLYPVASATVLQFQIIWFQEATWVPGTGEAGGAPKVVAVRINGDELEHALYDHTYLM
jgi:hypothetical protein